MKRNFGFILFLFVTLAYTQEEYIPQTERKNPKKWLESLTYGQSQDIEFYKNIKSGTKLGEYITSNGNSIKIGDTLIIGSPTSSSSYNVGHAWGQSSGNKNIRTGSAIAIGKSSSYQTFATIQLGRPAGVGTVLGAINGYTPSMAGLSFMGEKVIVTQMRASHNGGRKKPLYVKILLGEINGKAFGLNKVLTVLNTELAIEIGELMLKNRTMTRNEAIAKLKEAKDLLDLGLMSSEDFEKMRDELKAFILEK